MKLSEIMLSYEEKLSLRELYGNYLKADNSAKEDLESNFKSEYPVLSKMGISIDDLPKIVY